jgi:uncharacterized Zn-finger protein
MKMDHYYSSSNHGGNLHHLCIQSQSCEQQRRFVCPVPDCGKRFKRKFTLQEHWKTHSKARPYMCDFEGCDRCYSTHGNLNRHKSIHSGEKPFECPTCLKGFCSKDKMIRHLKTHAGVRPFSCNICSASFSTSGNLSRHKKQRHQHQKQLNHKLHGNHHHMTTMTTTTPYDSNEEITAVHFKMMVDEIIDSDDCDIAPSLEFDVGFVASGIHDEILRSLCSDIMEWNHDQDHPCVDWRTLLF